MALFLVSHPDENVDLKVVFSFLSDLCNLNLCRSRANCIGGRLYCKKTGIYCHLGSDKNFMKSSFSVNFDLRHHLTQGRRKNQQSKTNQPTNQTPLVSLGQMACFSCSHSCKGVRSCHSQYAPSTKAIPLEVVIYFHCLIIAMYLMPPSFKASKKIYFLV